MLTQSSQDFQSERIDRMIAEMKTMVIQAAKEGEQAHVVEQRIFRGMLQIGHAAFERFLSEQPSDDLGPTIQLPDGRTLRRCKPQKRRIVTVFGMHSRERIVYASREKQRAEVVPWDQRLGLPEGPFSYTLQDWCQSLAAEVAFKPATKILFRLLGIKMTVSSTEEICRSVAESVAPFQDSCAPPPPEKEGKILVKTLDHKGVPMIRTEPAPPEPHRTKGKKPKKRMAALGCTYTVDCHIRTPEEMTAFIFRDARPAKRLPESKRPPEPKGRRYYGSLSREVDGVAICGQTEVLAKMTRDVSQRRKPGQPIVYHTDGQRSLAIGGRACLPEDSNTVEVLDLMHVLERLWEASHLFHAEGTTDASDFVRKQLLRVLHGDAAGLVTLLRQKGTKRRLRGADSKRLTTICNFLHSNLHRMKYHEYLAAGYPVATGVIEGACRHIIKDRMERTGMRWSVPGAQAMLQLRTIQANETWQEFLEFRIQKETQRLYPYKNVLSRDEKSEAA